MADEKILESEKLKDDQLEEVAGGSEKQMEHEIQCFKNLGVLTPGVEIRDKDAIRRAFAAFGIIAEPHGGWIGKNNQYTLPGGVKTNDFNIAWSVVVSQWQNGHRPVVK